MFAWILFGPPLDVTGTYNFLDWFDHLFCMTFSFYCKVIWLILAKTALLSFSVCQSSGRSSTPGRDRVKGCFWGLPSKHLWGWGCSSVGRASDWRTADAGSIPRCGKGVFSTPRVNFQCRFSYGVRTPPHPFPVCAIACINIYEHVKDPVGHVRVRWIMETLKHLSMHRRLGSATLSQLAFSGGEKTPEFSIGEIPLGQDSWQKSK